MGMDNLIEKLKTCSKCHQHLPIENFGKDNQKKDGLRSHCKECRRLFGLTITPTVTTTHKTCSMCMETKLATEFYNTKRQRDGLHPECKACANTLTLKREVITPTVNAKVCSSCGELKSAECFSKGIRARSGLKSFCRACESLRNASRNFTEVTVVEKRCTLCKEVKPANNFHHSKLITTGLACMCKSCAAIDSHKRYLNNKPAALAAAKKRKATKLKATASWTDYKAVKRFYEESSVLTIETGVQHHVDHIIPFVNSQVCGLHVENNLQILTGEDNLRKHNSFIPGYLSDVMAYALSFNTATHLLEPSSYLPMPTQTLDLQDDHM